MEKKVSKKEEVRSFSTSFGDLFSNSFSEFTEKFGLIFRSFLFFYLVPAIVFGIIILLFMIITFPSLIVTGNVVSDFTGYAVEKVLVEDAFNQSSWLLIAIILLGVVLLVAFILFSMMMSLCYIHIGFEKKEIDFSEIFRLAREDFWKYVGLNVVTMIFLGFLFLLLIIPGVIFMVFWYFASYFLVQEGKGVLKSLGASMDLVKGRWWKVFGFILLMAIISIAVSSVGMIVPFVGFFISSLIVTPFSIIFFKNFYWGLRAEKGMKN